MSQPETKDPTSEKLPGMPPPQPPPGGDVEAAEGKGPVVDPLEATVRQWKNASWMTRSVVVLRALTLLFSFLSFIIMATNDHGYYLDGSLTFNSYQELIYVLAIAVISILYTMVQTGIKIHQLRTGKEVISQKVAVFIDFIGDQTLAYMLVSSASAASPTVVGLKQNFTNAFIDQSAASICMSFLAFFSVTPAALFSGYSLSAHYFSN